MRFKFRKNSFYILNALFDLSLLLLCIPTSSANRRKKVVLDERTLYGDPRRNITCLGNGYDLQLPLRPDGVDPNHFTMQQLCAKTIYGGAPAGQHLGGWCSRGLEVTENPELIGSDDSDTDVPFDESNTEPSAVTGVSFDLSPASHASAAGADPRFLLGCFNRCFCSWGVADLTKQPKRDVPSNADTYLDRSDSTGEILLDVTDDVTTTQWHHSGRLGNVEVDTVEITEAVEPNVEGGMGNYVLISANPPDPPWRLSLDVGNYITCEGDLPGFPLPQPYPVSEFRNPQELCAVQWSGGLS